MLEGKSPTVFGDGKQSRDFTFVENVVHGNLLAADAKGVAGQSFNLADGQTTDLLTLVRTLNEMLGLNIGVTHKPDRRADVRESMADITFARQRLGYEPQFSFEEGLRRSIDYYRAIYEAEVR
jgi:UDP-glucose 4-epimerase